MIQQHHTSYLVQPQKAPSLKLTSKRRKIRIWIAVASDHAGQHLCGRHREGDAVATITETHSSSLGFPAHSLCQPVRGYRRGSTCQQTAPCAGVHRRPRRANASRMSGLVLLADDRRRQRYFRFVPDSDIEGLRPDSPVHDSEPLLLGTVRPQGVIGPTMTAPIWPAFAAWIDALALARSLYRDSHVQDRCSRLFTHPGSPIGDFRNQYRLVSLCP